ncbi:baseplate wedge protein [Erwinia phage Fougasse]|nr:baseplate wedge protein [Erwinia phage Calisson]WJN64031.1 baseplate wedge protein [Erwinia phage Fougasse]WJN64264.1 baseplate wedge protein [Erwinia phage Nougat]
MARLSKEADNEYHREYMKTNLTVRESAAGDAAKKRYRERNPKKYRATNAVNNAIRLGRMIKMPCQTCGNTKSFAHHDNYNFPLAVRWLCDRCHKEWHKHNKPVM